ncbi:hypothetical protein ACM9XB_16530 [Xanthomonas sacchari]
MLGALSYPAQRIDTTRGAWSDATVQVVPDAGSGTFRVTQEQVDRLTQLADTVLANAQMVAAGDESEHTGQASHDVDSTLCAVASEMRELLLQITRQPLREPPSNRVREARAVYVLEPGAQSTGGEWLH